ncbi:hypothetical protein C1I63_18445 [Rathayibacter caricis DSM 15933]|uniref:Uncharacterized protein n=1 Tax=Rathayibacter caricis DSM 15933 TaxID=1328867 RepID=A0A2T4UNY7_9MICO|nr:hypothetical protein C1I63_18445 [Rathayibacter caricis DSM 15933]
MGNVAMAVAAVIAIGAGLATAAGTPPLGLVFVGAGGLLLAGLVLRLLGSRGLAARSSGERRWSAPAVLVAAAAAVVLTPVVYWAGMAYGSSWLEWDPVHSTNVYVERPGGFAVLLAALVVCAALVLFAVAAALIVAAQMVTRQRR